MSNMERRLAEQRDLRELAAKEKQDGPYGEAVGVWRCHCGEEVVWTRDALWKPYEVPQNADGFLRAMKAAGTDPKRYAEQERTAFLRAVLAEVHKHQLSHAARSWRPSA